MKKLPFVDEHAQRVDAPAEATWAAIAKVLDRKMRVSGSFTRLLGCDPPEATPEFTGYVGQTLPGFRIVDAEPGRRLALRGRHRFSEYALTFVVDGGNVRAESHAAFHGFLGRLYRAAVIGSGGHRIIVRQMLRDIARVAERAGRVDPRSTDASLGRRGDTNQPR